MTGVPLPSPRLVSSTSHPDISHLHSRYTLMVMQFAQFVDHDLTFTPVQRGTCSVPVTPSGSKFLYIQNIVDPVSVERGDRRPISITNTEMFYFYISY